MSRRMKIALGTVAAIVAVALGAVAVGRATFERRIARETAAMLAGSRGQEAAVIAEADLAGLPEPVRRWLRWAGVVGTEMPKTVRLTQEGRFRMGEGRPWVPFTATEVFTTDPPGFL